MLTIKNTKNVKIHEGYWEAAEVSRQYEIQRGRPGVPRLNLGLAYSLSTWSGVRGIGAVLLANELSGFNCSQEAGTARRRGVWMGFDDEGRPFVSDEPLVDPDTED